MTFKYAIRSLRHYGVRGAINFALDLPRKWGLRRKLVNTLVNDPDWRPAPGVTVVGSLSGAGSLPKVLRDLVFRLKACGIPCQAFDIGCENPIPASEYAHLMTPADEFRINRYTDVLGMTSLPQLPKMPGVRLSRIVFWEFDSGLCEYWPHLLEKMTTIAMSDYNLEVFRRLLPAGTPVVKILYPFQFAPHLTEPREVVRARYGIASGDFAVFFNFSYLSGYCRKNPEGAARAFAEAFGDRPDVKLVFKTSGVKAQPTFVARLKALINELGLANRVIFVDNFLLQDELVALTDACDAYLSLHRGEGFGIGIAEAMSLGKPVVVTDYSSTTEFCNRDDALPVPYRIKPAPHIDDGRPFYRHVKDWPEPDVHAAAAALRRLYDDRAFAKELGERGRRFVADHFSDANFKKSIETFLRGAPRSASPMAEL